MLHLPPTHSHSFLSSVELFAPQVVLTQVPVTARIPRLMLLEDDIIVDAPTASAPWLAVWSLAQSRLVAAFPATASLRPVEPQVAHHRHRHGRGEVVPCHEYRAVRNAVLALLARRTGGSAGGSQAVAGPAAAIMASCLAADGRSVALLLGDGTLLFMGRALATATVTVTNKTAVNGSAQANTGPAGGTMATTANGNNDVATPTAGEDGHVINTTRGENGDVTAAMSKDVITNTTLRGGVTSSPTESMSTSPTAMAEATDGRLSFQRRCILALSDTVAADASTMALCLWRSFGMSGSWGRLVEHESKGWVGQ